MGVVKDFHFQSLHVDLKPAVIQSSQGPNQLNVTKLALKIDGDTRAVLNQLEEKWNSFVPSVPFKTYFLDTSIQRFYQSEKATGKIFGVFTFLAILIACVGLLGLSAFVINQRVKEIGVRKVLGATVPQIMFLLSKDFTKLILVAAMISIPISYFWMGSWLDNFAYSIQLNGLIFILSGLAAMLIGLIVICIQSVKVAVANPIKSLKDE